MSAPTTRKLFTLLIELRCNSFCVFCGEREIDEALVRSRRRLGLLAPPVPARRPPRYTLASAREDLDRAREKGFDELSLQGGEPTLFAELPALIAHARASGFRRVGMVTNGRRLQDEGFTRALLLAGLHGISVSLLGPDAATHDALSAAPGAFDEMCAGLETLSREARRMGVGTFVDVNFIVSALSVDTLAEQVRLASRLGAGAGSVHLLRFDGPLSGDPGVRDTLRFDIRRAVPALEAAFAAADELSFGLHATDIPLCLHPTLRVNELSQLAALGAIGTHRARSAGVEKDVPHMRSRPDLAPCRRCLLAPACPRLQVDYLTDASCLTPLDDHGLSVRLDETLATIDPRHGDASLALVEWERVARAVAVIAPGSRAADVELARVIEAMRDLALLALSERRTGDATRALWSAFGLDPPRAAVDLGPERAPAVTTAASATVSFGEARLQLIGRGAPDGFEVASMAPLATPERSAKDRHLDAHFLRGVIAVLRGAHRLRMRDEHVEGDDGDGFKVRLFAVRRGAIRWSASS